MSSFILQVKRYDTYTCKKVEKKPNSFEVFMKKILKEFIFSSVNTPGRVLMFDKEECSEIDIVLI
jgi:hypothetical protein